MATKRAGKWKEEAEALRQMVLSCGLTEERKWGWPCFTLEGRNIVLIHCFKDYVAVLFFKGALLKDGEGLLSKIGAHTQAGRQFRFTSVEEIAARKSIFAAYVREAIAIEQAGLKVPLKKTSDYSVPDELKAKFKEDLAFKKAFAALTPGRQKAYLLHFAGAKQSSTRTARIEKAAAKIFEGKGLLDR